MKEIKAIIRPFVLDRVIDALEEIPDLPGITMSDVRGFGKAKESADPMRDVKKIKLEIMVPDSMAQEVVDRIARAAHTGNPGDGKIFVISVEDVIKIRTGERGLDAI